MSNAAKIVDKSENRFFKADNTDDTNFYDDDNNSLSYVFNDRRLNLRQRDRYVLSSSLPNKLKGTILKNWSANKYHGSNVASSLLIVFTTIIICVSALIFSIFVMPQLYEICLGLDAPNIRYLEFFYSICSSGGILLIILFFFGFILFFLIFSNFINRVEKMQEEADLLSLLASVKRNEQWKVLELVTNKKCFPKTFSIIRKAIESMKSGEKQDESFNNIGFSSYTEWFLHLSYFENDRSVLKEGSIILNERIMLSSISAVRITELIVLLIQCMFFAVFAYFIYSSMNNILLGCMP